jgi:hypothetical protein
MRKNTRFCALFAHFVADFGFWVVFSGIGGFTGVVSDGVWVGGDWGFELKPSIKDAHANRRAPR